MKRILMIAVASSLVGCATTRRGSVVMKVSETEAHVVLGKNEVNTGDHIELYRNICPPARGTGRSGDGGSRGPCRKESTGHGEIIQTLNEDYSVVKFPPGTQFSEGDTIEKHAH
jgi:hypothetical protein